MKMKEQINFRGMVLKEITPEEFISGEDVFKLSRWSRKSKRPFEWYFKLIKPVKSLKERENECVVQ